MFASVIWVIAELEGDKRVFGNRGGSSRSVTYNDSDRLETRLVKVSLLWNRGWLTAHTPKFPNTYLLAALSRK